MYFCEQDHSNALILHSKIEPNYEQQLLDPTHIKHIILNLDLNQRVKRYRRKSQQEYVKSKIKDYNRQLQQISNIQEITLQVDISQCEDDDILSTILEFIQEKLINQFKHSITKLSLNKCNFSYLLEKENDSDPIQQYLLDLIIDLKNLRSFSVVDLMSERNLSEHSVSRRFFNLVQNKIEIFQNIEELEIGYVYEFQHIITKKQSPQFFSFLLDYVRALKQINSLKKFKFVVNDLELKSEFFQKINQEILQFSNLKSIKLDFYQESQILDNTIQSIQTFQRLQDKLEVFEYEENCSEAFSISNIRQFTDELCKFKNLQSLSLKRFKLQSGCLEILCQSIKSLQQLESLTLDMSDFMVKCQEIENSIQVLNQSRIQLKSFDLSFPSSLKITNKQSCVLVNFLEIQKNYLENLQFSFSNIELDCFMQIMTTIEQIQQLKMFAIFFKNNKRQIKNKLVFTTQYPEQKNIFQFKNFNFCDYNQGGKSLNRLAASYLLKYQNSAIMKQLRLNYKSNKYDKSSEQFQQNMEQSIINLNNLEKIIVEQCQIILLQQLINNSSQSLKYLDIRGFNFNVGQDLFEQIQKCKNLIHLNCQISLKNNQLRLRDFCESLPNLQYLKIHQNVYFNLITQSRNELMDCSECLYSYFITELDIYPDIVNQQFLQFIKDKKLAILQKIAQERQIEQFLVYKSSQNFWDLYY
ncbi:hypothetical protein ABPG74_008096 [Tetrahymena malaccensis]